MDLATAQPDVTNVAIDFRRSSFTRCRARSSSRQSMGGAVFLHMGLTSIVNGSSAGSDLRVRLATCTFMYNEASTPGGGAFVSIDGYDELERATVVFDSCTALNSTAGNRPPSWSLPSASGQP